MSRLKLLLLSMLPYSQLVQLRRPRPQRRRARRRSGHSNWHSAPNLRRIRSLEVKEGTTEATLKLEERLRTEYLIRR